MVDLTLGKKLAEWIRKYGKNLLIAMLVLAVTYQETRRLNREKQLDRIYRETIEFERNRQEKTDELFREFVRNNK